MNERRRSLVLALLPAVALAFALGGFGAGMSLGYLRWGRAASAPELVKIRAALDRVRERYYTEVAAETLVDGALEGMVSRLDPYSDYFTAREYREFRESQLEGKFGGVGIMLSLDRASGYPVVETPVEGTPAFEADVLPGDQIREVDGAPVKGLALMEVVRRIKGEPGTPVTLTLHRAGREPFEVKLVRRIIVVKAVKARMLEGGIGYVRISDFTDKMVEQFDEEVRKLLDQEARALVLDVRFNPGGLLTECAELADRFLDEGVIVTTRGRTPEDERVLRAQKGDTLPPLPLAVLVNEGSASASEIFAGAMKDHRRGVLVGARTFGKGSVQTPFELPGGGALKLTTARYFTPHGTSVHRENGKKDYGIDPDYRVEMTLEEYDALKKRWVEERIVKGAARPKEGPEVPDPQLEAALEVLRARLEGRPPAVRERLVPKPPPSDE